MGTFPNKDTQIKPGQVLNPKGRPMRPSAQTLQKLLEDTNFEDLPPRMQTKIREKYGNKMLKEAMALSMMEMALDQGKGAVSAYMAVHNRHEGMPTQTVDVDMTNPPPMGDGELSRRLVSAFVELLKSRQGNGPTPPQPAQQGEPTNEHQTPSGGDGTGSPSAGSGERS